MKNKRGNSPQPTPRADSGQKLAQARELHRKGRLQEALQAYDALLAGEPGNPELLHLSGLVLFQSGKPEAAALRIAAALEFQPENPTALCNLASVCMTLQRPHEAVGHLREAVRLNPGHAPAWRSLGDALALCGQRQEAATAYEQALERWPAGVDAGSLPLNYAATLNALERYAEAECILRDILEACPGHVSAHCNLGHALREQGLHDEARKAFTAALALEPDMPQAELGLAGCLQKLGELDAALEHARRARELAPDEDSWFRLGHVLQELGTYDEARHCYTEALVCNPRCVVAMNNLGVLDLNEGHRDKAAHWLERARDCNPNYGEAWSNWANLLEKEGDMVQAELAARRAVELAPTPASLVRLGYILQREGRIDEALEVYRRYHELDPADSKGVALYLAGLGLTEMPSRASDAHVRDLFDHYAGFFERHLREKLEYRGPEVLLQALVPWLSEQAIAARRLAILDLGCGTGLCGAVLSPFAERLDGVDLSPRMLAKARKRRIYHELYEAELGAALQDLPRSYDLIVAGDVFVYLGDLAPVFQGALQRLNPGGRFAFTLETHTGDGVRVGEANRFQHSRSYLQELARGCGFSVLHLAEAVTRCEGTAAVDGLVMVLAREP